jgi:hypothetical protein
VKSLDQISVQPWQFGDKAQKKALVYGWKIYSNLVHTEIVEKGEFLNLLKVKKGEKKRMPMWTQVSWMDKSPGNIEEH